MGLQTVTGYTSIPELENFNLDDYIVKKDDIDETPRVGVIAGIKHSGKTVLGLSLPGDVLGFEMDRQMRIIHDKDFNMDPRITVVNGYKLLQGEVPKEEFLHRCMVQHQFFINALKSLQGNKPANVFLDGGERIATISEGRAKFDDAKMSSTDPNKRTRNPGYWMDRTRNMHLIGEMAILSARKNVLYSLYVKNENILENIGSSQTKRKVPKWVDVIMEDSSYLMQPFVVESEGSTVDRYIWIPFDKYQIWGEGGTLLRCGTLEEAADIMSMEKARFEKLIITSTDPLNDWEKQLEVQKQKQADIEAAYSSGGIKAGG